MTAGSTHTYPFRTSGIEITTDLPCEEEQYEGGVRQSLDLFQKSELTFLLGYPIPTIPRRLREQGVPW